MKMFWRLILFVATIALAIGVLIIYIPCIKATSMLALNKYYILAIYVLEVVSFIILTKWIVIYHAMFDFKIKNYKKKIAAAS